MDPFQWLGVALLTLDILSIPACLRAVRAMRKEQS